MLHREINSTNNEIYNTIFSIFVDKTKYNESDEKNISDKIYISRFMVLEITSQCLGSDTNTYS